MTVTAMPNSDTQDQRPRKRGKVIIAVLLVVLLLGGGAYFVLKPSKAGPPQPGPVDALDSIQINLSGGHYLRLGMALQLRKGVSEIDGSKALDAAINLFSGQALADINTGQTRNSLKAKLASQLTTLYHGDVMGLYFTEFVTQ
ncbi:flagellar basal body-associated FliL family protein [Nocardioides sp.]|uniref:flagellar basal body-associated FliL family protein n=1 Tax=Nocardioides sp. TaxID=35761 RepID=UPI002CA49304|nr:flagellar basal body-associated FliL family protein [Nocardioides sp.]HVX54598.1 flagellar basal body-associated FliL family protein [Nocardioides sp.]